jgi:hypothetical protein
MTTYREGLRVWHVYLGSTQELHVAYDDTVLDLDMLGDIVARLVAANPYSVLVVQVPQVELRTQPEAG